MSKPIKDRLRYEREFAKQGMVLVAGLDEAGRGPLAGPVAAGAVILPLSEPPVLKNLMDVKDSKKCTPRQKLHFYDLIVEHALAYHCGMASSEEIDTIGIAPAVRTAMQRAIAGLKPQPKALLIDYMRLQTVNLPQRSIKFGEDHSVTIAAASIIAKVTRDRLMLEFAEQYPQYGFEHNKGYFTQAHREALQEHGPSPIHRRSFAPLRTELFDASEAAR